MGGESGVRVAGLEEKQCDGDWQVSAWLDLGLDCGSALEKPGKYMQTSERGRLRSPSKNCPRSGSLPASLSGQWEYCEHLLLGWQ